MGVKKRGVSTYVSTEPLRDTRSGDELLRATPGKARGSSCPSAPRRELCGPESVDERDARDACERARRALSLRPCHGWSPRSPSHTCSSLGVLGDNGVRGRVGGAANAADCKRAVVGGA